MLTPIKIVEKCRNGCLVVNVEGLCRLAGVARDQVAAWLASPWQTNECRSLGGIFS